jgi:hypothetical protein
MISTVVGKKVIDIIGTECADQDQQHNCNPQIEPAHGFNYSPEKSVVYLRNISRDGFKSLSPE